MVMLRIVFFWHGSAPNRHVVSLDVHRKQRALLLPLYDLVQLKHPSLDEFRPEQVRRLLLRIHSHDGRAPKGALHHHWGGCHRGLRISCAARTRAAEKATAARSAASHQGAVRQKWFFALAVHRGFWIHDVGEAKATLARVVQILVPPYRPLFLQQTCRHSRCHVQRFRTHSLNTLAGNVLHRMLQAPCGAIASSALRVPPHWGDTAGCDLRVPSLSGGTAASAVRGRATRLRAPSPSRRPRVRHPRLPQYPCGFCNSRRT
mmetsp:Transcript_28282/g.67972  ORF Transcript_28282/g.67972 Transcript_28282/m.67972 type:complete len:261 (-) Transcript_28282:24-806(-)